jgi:hypothetical protein
MKVRVYCYAEDNRPYMKIVSDSALFDRFEKYLNQERMVRYDYVDLVLAEERDESLLDDGDVLDMIEDFGY